MAQKYCVSCGAPIPENQGSKFCSMCVGDADHGKDGYYRRVLEREEMDRIEEINQQYRDEDLARYEEETYG